MQNYKLFLRLFICLFSMIQQGAFAMELTSTAFQHDGSIPVKYTCVGDNISPPLSSQNKPSTTESLVLFMDDPDAPAGTWYHWVLYNIPADVTSLSENLRMLPGDSAYGLNSWGKAEYGGPCPPAGEHRYMFKLFALDKVLELPGNISVNQLESAMSGHVIAKAVLLGRFKK